MACWNRQLHISPAAPSLHCLPRIEASSGGTAYKLWGAVLMSRAYRTTQGQADRGTGGTGPTTNPRDQSERNTPLRFMRRAISQLSANTGSGDFTSRFVVRWFLGGGLPRQ